MGITAPTLTMLHEIRTKIKQFTNWQQYFKLLENQPQRVIIGIGLFMTLIIGIVDYFVIVDVALSIFYLVPIFLTTWFAGKKAGILIASVATIGWYFGDVHSKYYDYFWLSYWNSGVRLVFFLLINYLLSALHTAYEEEKYLARTDALTEVVNRRYFLVLLSWEIQKFHRYNRPFTLVYLDVDNFKMVNDKFGHSTVDRLLRLITHTIKREIREMDVVARLGGDEFALLLSETDYQGARGVLERLQASLMKVVEIDAYPVSFSIGAISFVQIPDSIDAMLERVDSLMYGVKLNGKNGIKHEIFG